MEGIWNYLLPSVFWKRWCINKLVYLTCLVYFTSEIILARCFLRGKLLKHNFSFFNRNRSVLVLEGALVVCVSQGICEIDRSAAFRRPALHPCSPFLPRWTCSHQWKSGQQTLTCSKAPAATVSRLKGGVSRWAGVEFPVGTAHGRNLVWSWKGSLGQVTLVWTPGPGHFSQWTKGDSQAKLFHNA